MAGLMSTACLLAVVYGHVVLAITATPTLLSPKAQVVPLGEEFRFVCRSTSIAAQDVQRQRHQLYRLAGSRERQPVGPAEAARCADRSVQAGQAWATLTTTFTLNSSRRGGEDQEETAAGRYGCLLLGSKREFPATVKRRHWNSEVTVEVCSEPSLHLERSESSDPIVVRAVGTRCYAGELTWALDGRRVPRAAGAATASGPAVESDDDALEIPGAACRRSAAGSSGARPCNATAVFTYVADGRVKRALMSQQIEGCCVPGEVAAGSGEDGAEGFLTTLGEEPAALSAGESDPRPSPPSPQDLLHAGSQAVPDEAGLENEVLALQRDVLQLRKRALPMQIQFLRRLISGDHSAPESDAELVVDEIL